MNSLIIIFYSRVRRISMDTVKEVYRKQAESLMPKFARRNIEAFYCETAEEAKELVLSMIPEGSTVTSGGSATLEETGILQEIQSSRYTYIARCFSSDPKEVQARYAQQVQADYYLLSTNAFTADGELVNIDASSNRTAMLLHGPRNVIIVAGMNKLAMTREDALHRIHNVAAPPNAARLKKNTPCARNGFCGDCHGTDTICCQEVITRHSMIPGRMKIILVGEKLGF